MEHPGPLVVMGVISLVCLFAAIRSLRRRRLHLDVPTSKAKGVFLGLNEIKGTSRAGQPLRSRMAAQPCVWYEWSVEEKWERKVTKTDTQGKTTTETESGWKTVARGGESVAFDLEDSTGRIRVVPEGANIDGVRSLDETCGQSDPLYFEHGPRAAISGSTHRRHLRETILPIDIELYVIGTARMRADIVQPEIAHAENAELFLISTKSEEQIVSGHYWVTLVASVVGAGLAAGIGWMLAQVEGALLGGGSFLGAMALAWTVLVYNGLASVRQRVEMSESMLDVQLRRRHILIPRLQSCVTAIAGHERSVNENVVAMRAKGDLIALVEAYPKLKSDAHFLQLQSELIDTEDRIALAREFVNNSVTTYNIRVETLPAAIIAKLTGHRRHPLSA